MKTRKTPKQTLSRAEVLEGELVTVFCDEYVDVAYKVGDTIYQIVNKTKAKEYDHHCCEQFRYESDGGRAAYDRIRHARKTAVTPYSKDAADISTLSKKQKIAFRVIVENGGIVSRKELSLRMGITTRSAIILMYKLLDEGIVSVHELYQYAELTNSADNVVLE